MKDKERKKKNPRQPWKKELWEVSTVACGVSE